MRLRSTRIDVARLGSVRERRVRRRRRSLSTSIRTIVAGEQRTLLNDRVVQLEHDAAAASASAANIASSAAVRMHKSVKLEMRSLHEYASSRAAATRLRRGGRSVGRQL